MSSFITNAARQSRWQITLASIIVLVVCSVVSPRAEAQEEPQTTVREWVYKRLNRAHEYLQKEKNADALSTLEELRRRERRMNGYEQALMWQTIGYIYSYQEKPKKAAEAFEKALSFGALPKSVALEVQFNLGTTYMMMEEFVKASRTLANWFSKVENPSPSSELQLANAYAQAKNYRQSLYHVSRAIERKKKPPQNWYLLKLAMQHELNQLRPMLDTLGHLVAIESKRTYWMQMAGVYNELNDEHRTLAVYELCHQQGFLTDQREIKTLARLYIQRGIPLLAAETLDAAIEDGEVEADFESLSLVAASWWQAREVERAIKPMGDAAGMSEDGETYIQLAQLFIEVEDWEGAVEAIQKGLEKGGLKNPGSAHLLSGIANLSAGKTKAAKKDFEKTAEFPKSRSAGKQWLKHLKQQQQK